MVCRCPGNVIQAASAKLRLAKMSIRDLKKADIYSPFITVVILDKTGNTSTGITNYECAYVLESKVFHMVF